MTISKTPVRISFVGGGSDLKAFYGKHIGCVISSTIGVYIFIFVNRSSFSKIQIKHLKVENVDDIEEIENPIIREAFKFSQIRGNISICSEFEIPPRSGLGTSSSFTVGLLNALQVFKRQPLSKSQLAEFACDIEINRLKLPGGKQDQYAASYGGLNYIEFYPDETVHVEPITMQATHKKKLEENLLIFYTGNSGAAYDIIIEQQKNILENKKTFDNLVLMTKLTRDLKSSLTTGNIDVFGKILDENWQLKRTLAHKISNSRINYYYNIAKKHGASGGKLCGAGGRGFLLFYCKKEYQERVRKALSDLYEVTCKFDEFGTRIIFTDA